MIDFKLLTNIHKYNISNTIKMTLDFNKIKKIFAQKKDFNKILVYLY